jgi:hypothetical protein
VAGHATRGIYPEPAGVAWISVRIDNDVPFGSCPGLNRNNAIFGWSAACVATNPSDVAVAFAALDTNVIVRGRTG